ncbi:hypothetical protein E2562_038195 [Oryza meyeriana var. granulata]|uniref:Uncharacterized protein n=1 Tax=Oryza meyeriana var. granulata TaxID=110450 RepID=A0A6G1DU31_9ORYZ|nr:hypothetical protein E2562_038195 [Oryza meyeriana var. granulata]
MVQKSRGWSGFISKVLEVVLKVSAVFNLWEVTSGSSCESNVGVVLISTLSTALRQNRPAGKSNARGKGDLIPSIDRPARLVSPDYHSEHDIRTIYLEQRALDSVGGGSSSQWCGPPWFRAQLT